ncbi:4-hydroxy-3-methylbut-2-enyl diphosphate reductase [Megalodesulfovibrio gigas]|nr:4-hydroxy-3-methylbut-2-enyl diphosphate reductase [Megalodesulfovibrio gigas]
MDVKRARTAGFCMGVSLALHKLDRLLQQNGAQPIHTLGPIIHNPQVLEHYAARGVTRQDDPDALPRNAQVVIRAHGVPQAVEEHLRNRGVEILDATCPKVKRAQLLIQKQASQGRKLLLFGEPDHPEVVGLVSYAGPGCLVFQDLETLTALPVEPGQAYVLASQTTQDRRRFEDVRAWLQARLGADLPVLETICDATRERQDEAKALAETVDVMVVVGGFDSGNTRRLVDVAVAAGAPCHHVETADGLDPAAFAGRRLAGLTAGASTPKHIIDAVESRLRAFA